MRLQALIRSRVLSQKFRHLRGHIVRLQARSRGYLVRRNYEKKMWAVIKIQSHVRRMVAQRKFRKLRVSVEQEGTTCAWERSYERLVGLVPLGLD